MKVEHSQNNRIVQKQAENTAAVERQQRLQENERADRLTNKDQASLSDRARLLSKARLSLQEIPDVRTERVAALREQIQAGTYQVPVEQLASLFLKGLKP
ncbi:MAG: flagellar biosynthesis anti-sigma factor FlgM [Anaerolineales bacterium]|nr:flagellar biosynthesis anti-sigma factor FlgM [Anaerolineales bacterium]